MIIGLDIGGTWMRGVAVTKNNVSALAVKTPRSLNEFKKKITSLVDDLAQGQKISGLGLGLAGKISPDKIVSSKNIAYLNGFKLPRFLTKKYKALVKMDNDARCFLRAEMVLGDGGGQAQVLGVTLGTGLGGALGLNGEIIVGSHYTAGQIANTPFRGKELENYASAAFLRRSKNNYKQLGENLAQGLLAAVNLFDPGLIIIGGGIMQDKKTSAIILRTCRQKLKSELRGPAKNVKVQAARLGDFAGALGAYLLVS